MSTAGFLHTVLAVAAGDKPRSRGGRSDRNASLCDRSREGGGEFGHENLSVNVLLVVTISLGKQCCILT